MFKKDINFNSIDSYNIFGCNFTQISAECVNIKDFKLNREIS